MAAQLRSEQKSAQQVNNLETAEFAPQTWQVLGRWHSVL
jgi:hypothetical protein